VGWGRGAGGARALAELWCGSRGCGRAAVPRELDKDIRPVECLVCAATVAEVSRGSGQKKALLYGILDEHDHDKTTST
jgi:hypothetical protein